HFLRSIADYSQRIGRRIPEQVIEVAAIERTAWNVVRRVGDDRGEIDVQRREHPFQMVGAAVEILRIDVGIDRVRAFPARAVTNSVCASRTGFVDFGGRPRDSSRIAVVIHSAWAMGYLRGLG